MATRSTATDKSMVVQTDSGVIFELALCQPGRWAVIASLGRQSITAEAIVGLVFRVGDNPHFWARGYAQIIQREVNSPSWLEAA